MFKMVIVLSILSSFTLSKSFEQNGVKDGNMRVSTNFYFEQPKDEDDSNSANLNTQIGYFMNNRVEVMFSLGLEKMKGADEFYYRLTPGINYYFYKTPIITPYFGARLYYWNSSYEYIVEEKGSSLCIGSHLFISEDVAISPEFGIDFVDFNSNDGTYLSTALTYFF
jgi:hypothetical protein